ncbi:regulator of chromosome condensation 1/beta-lactamase-inhibitor protein II [Cercophora scortea]|uniref:Regulator of chromosome condensation 1/beta-lactamase-inhibitor protein II n=1 Tax=Cercophora scortea TaxID=314031 RepID=A0AAE0MIA5_9PEZI|nr:regulator of chromosome condensation 1/beta-lactamase-inhibitor protein II [Cercophora scortea]
MIVLFALGSNGAGQLGIGHKEDVSVPKQARFSSDLTSPIASICAGGNHTLLLTRSGALFSAGDTDAGARGMLTPDQRSMRPQFQPVDLPVSEQDYQPFKVGLAAATWTASVITRLDPDSNKSTQVYTFGTGTKGELGLGDFIFRTVTPSAIPDFPPPGTHVIDLSACMSHVVAVLSNGDVWGWGNGRKGQLGAPEEVVQAPRRIEGLGFKVVRAVCGTEFTCLFGAAETGEIAVLGSDKWEIKTKAPSNAAGWKEVGASWGDIYVLREDGILLSWGRDDHGQIAPAGLSKTERIAVGSEHAVALGEDGNVVAWGWGEHGNCGPIGNASENGKGQQNVIASSRFVPPGAKITTIGAGCATSWVAIEMPTEDT